VTNYTTLVQITNKMGVQKSEGHTHTAIPIQSYKQGLLNGYAEA